MHHAIARVQQLNRHFAGADVGFLQGGCPIHLKEAPEVKRRSAEGDGPGEEPPPQKFFVFLISKWCVFCAFPVIFSDSSFQKGHPNLNGRVRTPWTPPGSAPVSC